MSVLKIRDENGVVHEVVALRGEGVGRDTKDGGVILNDYESNAAGTKVFKILDCYSSKNTLVLDETTGLEAGMECSMSIGNNYDFFGRIVSVGAKDVVFDKIPVSSISITDDCVLWIPKRPDLGTTYGWGKFTTAKGSHTVASRDYSSAEGCGCVAGGKYSHAEGLECVAAFASHAEGRYTNALGVSTHAEGERSTAKGLYSHAEGYNTVASGEASHSEGYENTASGNYSHAEGLYNTASGSYAHAEGRNTTASANTAHAEGFKTTASNQYTHAGGINSTASTIGSFVHGQGLTTSAGYQAVFGTHNLGNTNALFIVGNGKNENIPTNAFEVHNDGSALVYTQGADPMSVVQKQYVDTLFEQLKAAIKALGGTV